MNVRIKKIVAEGLHRQFRFELDLQPGLNIIYGKNGQGKTTLLHILANVLELDFDRFRWLRFSRIRIETFEGGILELSRDASEDRKLRIKINDAEAGSYERGDSPSPIPVLSQTEQAAIRSLLGGRPIYLPAFRAILERVRSDYSVDAQRTSEFERIRREEVVALRETLGGAAARRVTLGRNDPAALTARKTIQCREWFGQFTPMVRYPSILEVMDRLIDEVRDAQIENAASERRMLSKMFIDVFKALLTKQEAPSDAEIEPLMKRVSESLQEEEEVADNDGDLSDNLSLRLAQAIDEVKKTLDQDSEDAARRVLKLYAETLETRSLERRTAFSKVKQFEGAVNRFLEDKVLHVREDIRAYSMKNQEAVYIETKTKQRYYLGALSSGERQVITMLFSATRMTSMAHGLFLIDEPELSLHVDWQRKILGELVAQAPERQMVACTHSPEVGAEHMEAVQYFEPLQDPEDAPSEPGSAIAEDSL